MARTSAQRVVDAKAKLGAGGDVWLATAGEAGPHLVPLTMAWDQGSGEIILCTERRTVTVRNIQSGPNVVRVGIGPTRDVLMVIGQAAVTGLVQEEHESARLFADATGWDPRQDSGAWVFIRIRPVTIQSWRNVDEIANRTVMRHGQWVDAT